MMKRKLDDINKGIDTINNDNDNKLIKDKFNEEKINQKKRKLLNNNDIINNKNKIPISLSLTPNQHHKLNKNNTNNNKKSIYNNKIKKNNKLNNKLNINSINFLKLEYIFQEGMSNLQLSSLPKKLPCREDERKEIEDFIINKINKKNILKNKKKNKKKNNIDEIDVTPNVLYISGMPGTGKTATVYEVINRLKKLSQDQLIYDNDNDNDDRNDNIMISEFDFLEINAMRLPHPHHSYTLLYNAMKGFDLVDDILIDDDDDNDDENNNNNNNKKKRYKKKKKKKRTISAKKAGEYLENIFAKQRRKSNKYMIVLIDELDFLMTTNQNVLYNLFDWPNRQNSNLIVICIANSMNLPERFIQRVKSRLGMNRLVFSNYNHDQMHKILLSRLEDLPSIFNPSALKLCARKSAALGGDVRKALQLAIRAILTCRNRLLSEQENNENYEIKLYNGNGIITTHDIIFTLKRMQETSIISAIKYSTPGESLFYLSLVFHFHSKKNYNNNNDNNNHKNNSNNNNNNNNKNDDDNDNENDYEYENDDDEDDNYDDNNILPMDILVERYKNIQGIAKGKYELLINETNDILPIPNLNIWEIIEISNKIKNLNIISIERLKGRRYEIIKLNIMIEQIINSLKENEWAQKYFLHEMNI